MNYRRHKDIIPMEFALSLINTCNKDVPGSNHIGSIMLVTLGEINISKIQSFCLENIRQIIIS